MQTVLRRLKALAEKALSKNQNKNLVYKGVGYCPICECEVIFSADNAWFRDFLLCSGCRSIPRERVLMRVIAECFPNFRELAIHESSPVQRGASEKLKKECPGYSTSHYFNQIPLGQKDPQTGFRCESLESLTFADESFDLFVTQDVMEHVFKPDLAFREIRRVLKPGGAHIFTVPIINKQHKSEVWASQNELGETIFHQSAEYHGNDIDESGALVTNSFKSSFLTEKDQQVHLQTIAAMHAAEE